MYKLPVCIDPEQEYTIVYSDGDKGHWYDSVACFSYVSIRYNNEIFFSGHYDGIHTSVTFTYHPTCGSNEAQVTVLRHYGYTYSSIQMFWLYKGDSATGVPIVSYYMDSEDYQKDFTTIVCLEPNQQYFAQYSGVGWWSNDSNTIISYVSFIYQGHTIFTGRPRRYGDYTDSFVFEVCEPEGVQATLTRSCGTRYTDQESFEIYKGTPSNGTLVFSMVGRSTESEFFTERTICIVPEQTYTVILRDSQGDGWYEQYEGIDYMYSHFSISYNERMIYGGHLFSGYNSTETFLYHKTCPFQQIEATVTRNYTGRATKEAVRIFQGAAATTPLVTIFGLKEQYEKVVSCKVCLGVGGSYAVSTLGANGGWTMLSSVAISYAGVVLFFFVSKQGSGLIDDSFVVDDIPFCDTDGEWPRTTVGLVAILSCPHHYSGERTRACNQVGSSGVWANPEDDCTLDPVSIEYSSSSYKFKVGVSIPTLVPITTGEIISFDISEVLPKGLSFNNANGYISGTPEEKQDETQYTVTATGTDQTATTTITITVEEEDKPTCAEGEILTLFTKSSLHFEQYQCFSLIPKGDNTPHGDCPNNGVEGVYSDWLGTRISPFFYKCLTPDTYELHLTSFTTDDSTSRGDSWINDSYITIATLSLSGDTITSTRVVGSYSYTKTCKYDGSGIEDENVALINIGPVRCGQNEKVGIFEQYATFNANVEGFDLYQFVEDEYTLVNSIDGQATFDSDFSDPHSTTFICLPVGQYQVYLRQKSTLRENACKQCTGWSSVLSNSVTEYTDLNGTKVSKEHPSFMKITVLDSNEYDYLFGYSSTILSIEGENYAVFSGRTHIDASPYHVGIPETDLYDITDCHYIIFFSLVEQPCEFEQYIELEQRTQACIKGLGAKSGRCFLNGVELVDEVYSIIEGDGDCNGVYMTFNISSYEPVMCLFNRQQYFFYVKPTVVSDLPLHMSIDLDETVYEETCEGTVGKETYKAFDPFTLSVQEVSHITECHVNSEGETKTPPRGHSYVTIVFSVNTTESEDFNAAPSTTWFKQEFEYALSEVSHVPLRDVYITEIFYNNVAKSNAITVVIDTISSNGQDMMNQLSEESDANTTLISEFNAKLEAIYPAYWGTHKVEADSYRFAAYDSYCASKTDSSVEFHYLTETGQTETQIMTDVTFESTINWYYSYVNTAKTDDYEFTGAITRYCKPQYFTSEFEDCTASTQAQWINVPWENVHFNLLIEDQNPLEVDSYVRYSIARSILSALLHNDASSDDYYEIFDVNVYMVEGDSPSTPGAVEGDDGYKVYQNTKFYVEVRIRDAAQKSRLIDRLNALIDATGELNDDIKPVFVKKAKSLLGESFSLEEKAVKILNIK